MTMTISLAFGQSGCEEMVKDPVIEDLPGAQNAGDVAAAMLPNSTVILDRSDLLAIAAPGVTVTPSVISDIQDRFPENPDNAAQDKTLVVYAGPISFNHHRGDERRLGKVSLASLEGLEQYRSMSEGPTVMWANLQSERLYLIHHASSSDQAPAQGGLDNGFPDFEPPFNPVQNIVENDNLVETLPFMPAMKRWDRKGGLHKHDTRYRVFEENEPVRGKFFKRLLSIGGGTGALIGARHFITAAHVVLYYDKATKSLEIEDVAIRAGRNGRTQLGETAGIDHLYWMADWTEQTKGTYRRAFDMAWGVMDEPLGKQAGFFGYYAMSTASLNSKKLNLRNAGYSSCHKNDQPVPPDCIDNHIFMDSDHCAVLGEAEPDSKGWGRAVAHSCDTNPGHSGSPMVVTHNGSLYVWAVDSGWANGLNYASRLTANRASRLIPEMFEQYPRYE